MKISCYKLNSILFTSRIKEIIKRMVITVNRSIVMKRYNIYEIPLLNILNMLRLSNKKKNNIFKQSNKKTQIIMYLWNKFTNYKAMQKNYKLEPKNIKLTHLTYKVKVAQIPTSTAFPIKYTNNQFICTVESNFKQ